MAGRPDKYNADYFSHDNCMRNDKKIKAVRAKFGIQGYAIYNMLLEILTEADLLMIRNSEMEIEMLAGDFGIVSKELIELLEYFCRINLIKMDKNFITCPQLEKRLSPIFEKRKKNLSELRSNYCRINRIITTEIDNSVKSIELPSRDSKVKESKVKENTPPTPLMGDVSVCNIFAHWNSKSIITHKKLTDKMRRAIKTALVDRTAEEITQAISNYAEVFLSDKYYWSHRWTLVDFLKRGLDRFVDEADPLNNFLAKNNPKQLDVFHNEPVTEYGVVVDGKKVV